MVHSRYLSVPSSIYFDSLVVDFPLSFSVSCTPVSSGSFSGPFSRHSGKNTLGSTTRSLKEGKVIPLKEYES